MATTLPEFRPAPPDNSMLQQIYENVVTRMPPGGLTLMFVLVGLTLIVGLWIVFSQHTLARNQVRLAEMLARHMAEHDRKDAG